MAKNNSTRPEKVFRIGFVSASVWPREIDGDGGKRTLRSVNIQRRYLDGDEAKYTSSFALSELPQAIEVLKRAMDYVADQEAEVVSGD